MGYNIYSIQLYSSLSALNSAVVLITDYTFSVFKRMLRVSLLIIHRLNSENKIYLAAPFKGKRRVRMNEGKVVKTVLGSVGRHPVESEVVKKLATSR